jgi:hypothetical protein
MLEAFFKVDTDTLGSPEAELDKTGGEAVDLPHKRVVSQRLVAKSQRWSFSCALGRSCHKVVQKHIG